MTPNRAQVAALEHVHVCFSDFCESSERAPQESLRTILQAVNLYENASAGWLKAYQSGSVPLLAFVGLGCGLLSDLIGTQRNS